ncbi:alpha/beta hydrolase family protein [Paraferrimonas sedimenticola]|uniref:Peptidase S9 n=1 Tax=Paraferrimonas sedimenticola TaxID=375674 RepID=A0AA37RTG7_9GAMM|nr:prolyl oligopeptidase family serine peptidase [Paraferrimonas sedimenticola]GLP95163.1 peptidase S9 [Paraferrimonas sedimenticola]
MSKRYWLLLVLCLSLGRPTSVAAQPLSDAQVDMENGYSLARALFRGNQYQAYRVSPNGRYVSYLDSNPRKAELRFIDTQALTDSLVLTFDVIAGQSGVADYEWADDNTLVFELLEKRKRRLTKLELKMENGRIKADGTELVYRGAHLINALPELKDTVILGRWYEGKHHVFKVNLNDKDIKSSMRATKRLNKNNAPIAGFWGTDNRGRLTMAAASVEDKRKVWVKYRKRRGWNLVWEGSNNTQFIPVLWDESKDVLWVISNQIDNYASLYRFDVKRKSFLEKVIGIEGKDLSGVRLNPQQNRVLGVTYLEGGLLQTHYFDDQDDSSHESVSALFDGATATVVDYSQDSQVTVYFIHGNQQPGQFYLHLAASNEFMLLADQRPWLSQVPFSKTEVVVTEFADGTEMESYLTIPTHPIKGIPPLLVVPHGGPIAVRDTRYFDEHVQMLAGLGYAVLQPNYRGSSGFGKAFLEKGKGQWGRLIEEDIEAVTRQVLDSGRVDGSKVCIYGISYGGYSALINGLHRPELYHCVASYAGVTDIPLLFTEFGVSQNAHHKQLLTQIVGNPDTQLAQMMEYSPVYQIDQLRVPLLLAQGGKDPTVDQEHYLRMKQMLDLHKKPYTPIFYKNEIHGFRYRGNAVDFYLKLDKFLRKSMKLEAKQHSIRKAIKSEFQVEFGYLDGEGFTAVASDTDEVAWVSENGRSPALNVKNFWNDTFSFDAKLYRVDSLDDGEKLHFVTSKMARVYNTSEQGLLVLDDNELQAGKYQMEYSVAGMHYPPIRFSLGSAQLTDAD